jgi:hypothetical protein
MTDQPRWTRPNSILRWLIAIPVVAAGLVVFAEGASLETRPRTNDEDFTALCIFAMGSSMIGVGISIPFARPLIVILVAIASPVVVYALVLLVVWVVLPLIGLIRLVIRI